MLRLEHTDNAGVRRFWEAKVDDAQLLVRHGRVGTLGHSVRRVFANHFEAVAALKSIVSQKRERGWEEPPAHWQPDSAFTARDEAQHLRAIADDPDDVERFLVYADWLLKAGRPRGELIFAHHRVNTATDSSGFLGLQRLHDRMFADYGELLLGPLHEDPEELKGLTWRLGFLETADLDGVWRQLFGVAERVRRIVESPSGRFLRDLRFRVGSNEVDELNAILRDIVRAGEPRTLRFLGITTPDDSLLDLDGVLRTMGRLESLDLNVGAIRCRPLRHAGLREMRLRAQAVFAHGEQRPFGPLLEAALPSLTELELQLRPEDPADLEQVPRFLSRETLPNLRILDIATFDDGDHWLSTLFHRTNLLEQLEVLRVTGVQGANADRLVPLASRVQGLERFLIEVTRESPGPARAALRAMGALVRVGRGP